MGHEGLLFGSIEGATGKAGDAFRRLQEQNAHVIYTQPDRLFAWLPDTAGIEGLLEERPVGSWTRAVRELTDAGEAAGSKG